MVDSSHKFCENTMRDYCAHNFGVNHTYVCHPYVGQNWKQAGARQFFPPIVLQQTYMKSKFETTELTQSLTNNTKTGIHTTIHHEPFKNTNDLE